MRDIATKYQIPFSEEMLRKDPRLVVGYVYRHLCEEVLAYQKLGDTTSMIIEHGRLRKVWATSVPGIVRDNDKAGNLTSCAAVTLVQRIFRCKNVQLSGLASWSLYALVFSLSKIEQDFKPLVYRIHAIEIRLQPVESLKGRTAFSPANFEILLPTFAEADIMQHVSAWVKIIGDCLKFLQIWLQALGKKRLGRLECTKKIGQLAGVDLWHSVAVDNTRYWHWLLQVVVHAPQLKATVPGASVEATCEAKARCGNGVLYIPWFWDTENPLLL